MLALTYRGQVQVLQSKIRQAPSPLRGQAPAPACIYT